MRSRRVPRRVESLLDGCLGLADCFELSGTPRDQVRVPAIEAACTHADRFQQRCFDRADPASQILFEVREDLSASCVFDVQVDARKGGMVAPMSGRSMPRDADAPEGDQLGRRTERVPWSRTVAWVVSSALFSVSIAVLAWIVIGHRSVDDPHPDYAIHPPRIPAIVTWAAGIVALLVAAVFACVFWRTARRSTRARRFVPVIAMLVAAGVYVGLTGRMLTDGVIGVNIGAAFLVLFVGPVVLSLLVFAVVRSWVKARKPLDRG